MEYFPNRDHSLRPYVKKDSLPHGQIYMFVFIINHSSNLEHILYYLFPTVVFLFNWNNFTSMKDLNHVCHFCDFYKLQNQAPCCFSLPGDIARELDIQVNRC